MNSPITTPISAKDTDGVSEAKVQARVEGTTTVHISPPLSTSPAVGRRPESGPRRSGPGRPRARRLLGPVAGGDVRLDDGGALLHGVLQAVSHRDRKGPPEHL